jgi:hypothetical protein
MVNTVADNKANFTKSAYARAMLARNIRKMIGRPTTKEFHKIIGMNLLPNCPVTRKDILVAKKIFGLDVGLLEGKTVRHGTDHVEVKTVPVWEWSPVQWLQVLILCGEDVGSNPAGKLFTPQAPRQHVK